MAKLRSISTRSFSPRSTAKAIAFLTLSGLASCSGIVAGSDLDSLYKLTKAAWSGQGQNVSLAEAASVPYASMGIRLGDGPEGLIVLAGDNGGQRLWTSALHIALTTKDGRIVRTAGLAHNLSGYQIVRITQNADGTQTRLSLVDFADLGLYSVPIYCRDRHAGSQTIIILGKEIHTTRINETCASRSSRLDWSFHNTYWRDPETGLTWRSIQHVHPNIEPLETEILRPPG